MNRQHVYHVDLELGRPYAINIAARNKLEARRMARDGGYSYPIVKIKRIKRLKDIKHE